MKKNLYTILFIILISLTLTSCKKKDADLVASFYPHYDILKNISKDKLKVDLVVPFGCEVHDFTPTPKDIEMINKSKLFVYASDKIDVWVKDLINTNINYVNLSNEVTIEFSDDIGASVHFWTDTLVFVDMIDILKDEIIKIDPENADFYTENANNYKTEILALHDELVSFLNETTHEKVIYFAGHDALGGFSHRYNIKINSLIEHFSPEAEQTIRQIENIISALRETNTEYLFIEELTTPRVAETIRRELQKDNLDVTLLELHGYHNISLNEGKRGVTYADLLRQNIKHIKQAINWV